MNAVLEALAIPEREVAGVLDTLRAQGATVAVAESLTAGLVCAALTSVPGSSAAVRGGLVVYATDLKSVLAGVDAGLLAEHGAVHERVAAELAAGAALRCGADYGLGLTGVAGPDPQDGAEPGTVHVALHGPAGSSGVRHLLAGDRHAVRAGAARAAIRLLAGTLGTGTGADDR